MALTDMSYRSKAPAAPARTFNFKSQAPAASPSPAQNAYAQRYTALAKHYANRVQNASAGRYQAAANAYQQRQTQLQPAAQWKNIDPFGIRGALDAQYQRGQQQLRQQSLGLNNAQLADAQRYAAQGRLPSYVTTPTPERWRADQAWAARYRGQANRTALENPVDAFRRDQRANQAYTERLTNEAIDYWSKNPPPLGLDVSSPLASTAPEGWGGWPGGGGWGGGWGGGGGGGSYQSIQEWYNAMTNWQVAQPEGG